MTDFADSSVLELTEENTGEIQSDAFIIEEAESLGNGQTRDDGMKGGGGANKLFGGIGTHIGSRIHSDELVRIASRLYAAETRRTQRSKTGSTNTAAMTSSEAFLAMMP